MKKIKRLITIFIAGTMMVSGLIGCGKSEGSTGDIVSSNSASRDRKSVV